MKYFKYFLFLTILCLSGCAITYLETIKNPEFSQIKKEYKNLLIVFPFSKIKTRKKVEQIFVKEFNRLLNIKAISGIEVFPPFKDYNQQEITEILIKNNIDSALILTFQSCDTKEHYIPQFYSATFGSISQIGNSIYYKNFKYGQSGYYTYENIVNFEISLFDRETDKIVWLAVSTTEGDEFCNFVDIIKSLADKVAEQLIKEGIIERKK
ncbi:MAG: hypothetical protein NC833_06190 [Candidatus Omnitrophica bacterium]|nr:hypothetical protein [Candidatus Omnitrophota bacterium]